MKILHTMIRVQDLDISITFYRDCLGMEVLKKKDYPHGDFTLCFMGYQPIEKGHVIELTHNWDNRKYDVGSGYGHIAIGVEDIYKMCDAIKAKGGKVTREPGPMKNSSTILAFIEDPDGYKIELIQE